MFLYTTQCVITMLGCNHICRKISFESGSCCELKYFLRKSISCSSCSLGCTWWWFNCCWWLTHELLWKQKFFLISKNKFGAEEAAKANEWKGKVNSKSFIMHNQSKQRVARKCINRLIPFKLSALCHLRRCFFATEWVACINFTAGCTLVASFNDSSSN